MLALALLGACGTSEPGGDELELADVVGRWKYTAWVFTDPATGAGNDYLGTGTAVGDGSLEIAADGSIRFEQFAFWIGQYRRVTFGGTASVAGTTLTLDDGTTRHRYAVAVEAGGNRLQLTTVGQVPELFGDQSVLRVETITLEPDAAPPALTGRIVFESGSDIWVMNADGTGRVRLTTDPAVDADPAWSADGQRIAFVSHRDGNPEIYAMNADGSGVARLTDLPGADLEPDWSPDGTRIVFSRFNPLGTVRSIHVMNADGSDVAEIGPAARDRTQPAWSPDGTRIAFLDALAGLGSILGMTPEGTNVSVLAAPAGTDVGVSQPAWSPSADRLAYLSHGHGTTLIAVNVATGVARGLAGWARQPGRAAWSPDGGAVAFESGGDIYVVRADGGGFVNLSWGVSAPEGAPDWRQ